MGGFNTLIEELHNNLINDINKSQLPVGIIYYVLKDVYSNVEYGYNKALEEEKNNAQIIPQKEQKEEEPQENEN